MKRSYSFTSTVHSPLIAFSIRSLTDTQQMQRRRWRVKVMMSICSRSSINTHEVVFTGIDVYRISVQLVWTHSSEAFHERWSGQRCLFRFRTAGLDGFIFISISLISYFHASWTLEQNSNSWSSVVCDWAFEI